MQLFFSLVDAARDSAGRHWEEAGILDGEGVFEEAFPSAENFSTSPHSEGGPSLETTLFFAPTSLDFLACELAWNMESTPTVSYLSPTCFALLPGWPHP